MTTTAIVLILLSALLHVGWNLISKKEHPSAAFFSSGEPSGQFIFKPGFFLYGGQLVHFPALVWGFIGLTGLFQALYMISLAGAYRLGDISIAYPLIRSSPIIVVTIVVLLLGRGDQVSWQSILGIGLVVAGSALLPMRHFTDFRLVNYLNPACLLGLVAACCTAGYSIVDDEALQQVWRLPEVTIGTAEVAVLYAFTEGISTCLWLMLLVLPRRTKRAAFVQVVRTRKWPISLTGIGMYMTYPLVLISMAFVSNVSYVVAFRQSSIPLGVALGVFLLGEPGHVPKFWGAAIIFVGLVLVGTG